MTDVTERIENNDCTYRRGHQGHKHSQSIGTKNQIISVAEKNACGYRFPTQNRRQKQNRQYKRCQYKSQRTKVPKSGRHPIYQGQNERPDNWNENDRQQHLISHSLSLFFLKTAGFHHTGIITKEYGAKSYSEIYK
jgi:hypothetical protein